MRKKIQRNILLALLRANGEPMPDEALIGACFAMFPVPPRAEVKSVITELEVTDYIAAADDEITGCSWTLTTKGKHAAQQL